MKHTCNQCGTEYEGKFCPNCGKGVEAAQEEPKTQNEAQARDMVPSGAVKFYDLLPYVPTFLFTLFAVLSFLFFLGPATPFGGFGLIGSVYGMLIPGDSIATLCIVLVALAALSFVFACVMLLFCFKITLRVKRAGSGGKLRVLDLLTYFAYALYLASFIVSIVLITKTTFFGTPGAALLCTLLFALFFALISVGAMLAHYLVPKKNAAFANFLKERADKARAEIGVPVKPQSDVTVKPEYSTAIPVTPEHEQRIEKYVKKKRSKIIMSMTIFPLLVAGAMMASNILLMKRFMGASSLKERKPIKVCKRRWLLAAAIYSFLWAAIGVAGFVMAAVWTFMPNGYLHGDIPIGIEAMVIAVLFVAYFLPNAIFSLKLMKAGKALATEIYGAPHPKMVPALEEAYRSDCEKYEAYCAEYKRYIRKCAFYEEGKAYKD